VDVWASGTKLNAIQTSSVSLNLYQVYTQYQLGRAFRFRFRFPNVTLFKPVKTNFFAINDYSVNDNPSAMSPPSQANCASYFLELWSPNGFPMPAACWVRVPNYGTDSSTALDLFIQARSIASQDVCWDHSFIYG
jgi:hypothetical protein